MTQSQHYSPRHLVLLPVFPEEEGVAEEEQDAEYGGRGEQARIDERVEADDVERERRADHRGERIRVMVRLRSP